MLSFAPMGTRLIYWSTLLGLIAIGAWGLSLLAPEMSQKKRHSPISEQAATAETMPRQALGNAPQKPQSNPKPSTKLPLDSEVSTDHLRQIANLLDAHRAQQAANYINQNYPELSASELEKSKQLFIQQARSYELPNDAQALKNLAMAAAKIFNDVEFWEAAALAASAQQDWQTALSAQRQATLLENRPERVDLQLFSLVKIARHLRTEMLADEDQLSVRRIYQALYLEHPNYAPFAYELALAHLRLDDQQMAEQLFKQLLSEPQFTNLAQTQLDKLRSRSTQTDAVDIEATQSASHAANDIVVPLRRVGNSFMVNGSLRGTEISLLLDTGASITALNKSLIERLKLSPTGEVIRLNTANGETRSRLYKAENLRLGGVNITSAVVAEIELTNNVGFQGLLGTDLLNQADPRYSYLIDNAQNALIFRLR